MDFEWDPKKAEVNERKHGISFLFASRVFQDESRLEKLDGRVDYGEERWVTIGLVEDQEIVVIYTLREDTIRIISARREGSYEQQTYWNGQISS